MTSMKKRRMAIVWTTSPYECVFDTTAGKCVEDESEVLKPKSLDFGNVPVVSDLQSQDYVQEMRITATRATPLKRRFAEPIVVIDHDDDDDDDSKYDTAPKATPLKRRFAVPFEDWCSTGPSNKSPVMASSRDGADPQRMVAAIASPMRSRRSLHCTSSHQNGTAQDWCRAIASPMRSRRLLHDSSSYQTGISQDRPRIQRCIPTVPEIGNQTDRPSDDEGLNASERLSDSDATSPVTSEATNADLTEGPSDEEEASPHLTRQSSVRTMRSEKSFNSPVVISHISAPELETPTEQRSDISSLDETPTDQRSDVSSLDVDQNFCAASPTSYITSPAELGKTVAVTQAVPAPQVAIQRRSPAELVKAVAVTHTVSAPQVVTQGSKAAPTVCANALNDVPQSAPGLQVPQEVPAMSSLAARVAAIRQALRQ